MHENWKGKFELLSGQVGDWLKQLRIPGGRSQIPKGNSQAFGKDICECLPILATQRREEQISTVWGFLQLLDALEREHFEWMQTHQAVVVDALHQFAARYEDWQKMKQCAQSDTETVKETPDLTWHVMAVKARAIACNIEGKPFEFADKLLAPLESHTGEPLVVEVPTSYNSEFGLTQGMYYRPESSR